MAIIGSFSNSSADTLTVTSISELPTMRLSELIDVDNASLSVIGGSF